VLATIVVLFGARAWVRNRDWRDDVTLWTSAVKASPNSFKAHKGLADALYDANPSNPDWKRITSEADRSIAILDSAARHDERPCGISAGDRVFSRLGRCAARVE
jgi:hypothetical protein